MSQGTWGVTSKARIIPNSQSALEKGPFKGSPKKRVFQAPRLKHPHPWQLHGSDACVVGTQTTKKEERGPALGFLIDPTPLNRWSPRVKERVPLEAHSIKGYALQTLGELMQSPKQNRQVEGPW